MECLIVAAALLGGLLLMSFLIAVMAGRGSRVNRAFREASRRLHGRAQTGGWFRRPAVHFQYGDMVARITTVRIAGVESTEFLLTGLATRWEFELIGRNPGYRSRYIRWGVVEAEKLSVLGAVELRSPQVEELADQLNDGVIWALSRFQAFMPNRGLYVLLHKGQLLVRKWGVMNDPEMLVQFARLGGDLFEQISLDQSEGIDFCDDLQATLVEDVDCPICGEKIVETLVMCTRCKTPHHQDCWDYNGRCATFACGEERYVIPGVARSSGTAVSPDVSETSTASESSVNDLAASDELSGDMSAGNDEVGGSSA